jgi:hypothetical protein
MAELCEKHQWGWFDLAGNCRIEIPGVFLVERSGNVSSIAVARSRANSKRPRANLGTPESGRIIRALLVPENARRRWTQRDIVAEFSTSVPAIPPPSLALVNKVSQYLRDQDVIDQDGKRGFRVRDHEGLLRMWRAAYRFDCHVRKPYFSLLKQRVLQDRLRTLDPGDRGRVVYASFSAADWQAPTVRQPRTWLYVDPNAEDEFRSVAEAKPVDSGENLVVLLPQDRGVFYRVETSDSHVACTNSVQTYIDLVHAGGRGEEAAEAILERRLKPAWAATLS